MPAERHAPDHGIPTLKEGVRGETVGFPTKQALALRPVSGNGKRDIAIIGAALDLGQGRRGVDMGPSAIR